MTKIKEIIQHLETLAPLAYQEEYDNAGLITGNAGIDVRGVLICLDSTEAVIDEALSKNCNLIIAHHPIIFRGLKRLTGRNYVERTIIKAIKNEIAIYAIHTNLDNVKDGVNAKIAERLGLQNIRILQPGKATLKKLITFIPRENTVEVLDAMHRAGAGIIGDYDHCSFRVSGTGRFKPSEKAAPHIGEKNQMEEVKEDRVEVIISQHRVSRVLEALRTAHPYEEVAYYLHDLGNVDQDIGSGMLGDMKEAMTERDFLDHLNKAMDLERIKYTPFEGKTIRKVAVCGGAGSFLLTAAKSSGADAFVSADFKYHDYFDAEGKILIADIGHYESEVYTKEHIYELLNKKFSSIALCLSEVNTNPIRYR